MTWLATEDFESYTATANLSGGAGGANWSGNWTTVTGTFTVENSPSGGGKVAHSNTTNSSYRRSVSTVSYGGRIRFRMRVGATPNDEAGVWLGESGTPILVVAFQPSGKIQTFDHDTTAWVDLASYSVNTWYTVDIEWIGIGNTYRVRIDDGAWSANFEVSGSTVSPTDVGLYNFATNSASLYVDDIQPTPSERGAFKVGLSPASRIRLPVASLGMAVDPDTTGVTVTGWLKRTAGAGGAYKPAIWGSLVSSGYWFLGWDSAAYPSEDFYIEGSVRVGGHESFSSQPVLNEWVFCAYTLDIFSAFLEHVYWYDDDYTQQGHKSASSGGSVAIDYIEIGTQDTFSGGITGYVAQGRVFDRVLTQAEIEAEMQSSSPVLTANCLSAFENDPGIDVTGHGNAWEARIYQIDPAEYPPNYDEEPPPEPGVPNCYVVMSNIRMN
jgi:hypothetical protein